MYSFKSVVDIFKRQVEKQEDSLVDILFADLQLTCLRDKN